MIEYSVRLGTDGSWAVEQAIDGLAPVHMATCGNEADAREIVAALTECGRDRRAAAALADRENERQLSAWADDVLRTTESRGE